MFVIVTGVVIYCDPFYYLSKRVPVQLTPRTPDLEVRGSSLACRVVISLDKELYSTLSLFTQLYKWVPATYCWGGNLAKETGISSGRLDLWLLCALTFCFTAAKLDGVVLEQLIRCLHVHIINYYFAEISSFRSGAFK